MARPSKAASNQTSKRIYRGTQEVDSDLYKLDVADQKINTAIDNQPPIWESMPHGHFYRTFDSSGKKIETSCPVGGHFHIMTEVKPASAGNPPVFECSPPMRWMNRRDQYGRSQRVMEKIATDNHAHEVSYRRSERIKIRELNAEFVKFQSQEEAKAPAPLEGIQG